jgi:FtsP/CotA-like multicopper oxidase with cupredoxin domain
MTMREPFQDTRTAGHRLKAEQPESMPVHRWDLSFIAALFTVGSALIHLTLVPPRAQEYLLYGLFVGAVALVQLGLAAALALRPSSRLARYGTLIGLGIVVAIIAFQSVALPIGPHPWQPVGFDDADSTGIGTMVFATIALLLLAWRPMQRGPSGRIHLVYIPVAAVVLILTFFGIASAINETPAALNMSAPMKGMDNPSPMRGMDMSTPMPPGQATKPMDSLREPPGNQPVKSFTLVAEVKTIDGRERWVFNGSMPGPELRVTQGDRLRVTLVNHLPVATTIHWHGVSLPNAEDGVAGVTQDAVRPGSSYTYEFVAKDPGTYMYHSHQDSFHQVLQGLFGALIVEPRAESVADRDYALVIHEASSGRMSLSDWLGELIIGAPANQVPAVNGTTGDLHLEAKPGERVRLRLIGVVQSDMKVSNITNMMHASPQELVLLGTDYAVVALDGYDLNGPQAIGAERLRIGIGQRYDLTFTMPADGAVRLVDTSGTETVTLGDGPVPPVPNLPQLPAFDLTTYGSPGPDPITADSHFDVTYPVVLGNHFGFREGRLELVHTINGQNAPMGAQFVVRQGQVVRLHIDNETEELHTMHLHGHHFVVLAHNGRPLPGSPIHLDSLLVEPHENWDVAFLADNPGLWMFHCHVLVHADFGMSAMVVYEGVTTPYDIGSRSGNNPE